MRPEVTAMNQVSRVPADHHESQLRIPEQCPSQRQGGPEVERLFHRSKCPVTRDSTACHKPDIMFEQRE